MDTRPMDTSLMGTGRAGRARSGTGTGKDAGSGAGVGKRTAHAGVIAAALAVLLAAGAAQAAGQSIQLPGDGLQWQPSSLPGYAKVQQNCVACHSAEYAAYQPPTAPRAYWDAMVKRMKAVFGAPLDDADMPLIVDYLAKTYGNEKPSAGAAASSGAAAPPGR